MKLLARIHLLPLAVLISQLTHASTLTWDANGTGTGQTNGGGAWLGTNLWWNGSNNQNWVSGSVANFGGPSTAGGAVTLASPTTVGSITFNTFTGTYTLGSVGQTITLNGGLLINAGAGAVSLSASPIILGAAQSWTNLSTSALTASVGVGNGGHLLTIDGTGATSVTGLISGDGGLTKNGTGRLTFHTGNNNTYSGTTTINGGVLMAGTGVTSLGTGNLTLNGGVLEHYWSTAFTRSLGTEAGQVQILGGGQRLQ